MAKIDPREHAMTGHIKPASDLERKPFLLGLIVERFANVDLRLALDFDHIINGTDAINKTLADIGVAILIFGMLVDADQLALSLKALFLFVLDLPHHLPPG